MTSVPVLLYHHVAPDREVTPEGFGRQLEWLAANGYRTLSIQQLRGHLSGAEPAPDGSVVVTFDDGYADNWVYAFPLLKRRRMKAVMFVVTGLVGEAREARPTSEEGGALRDTVTGERDPQGFLNWAELKAMARSGLVEIGSHTHTHRGFARERPFEDLREELTRSRELIEGRLGAWCGAIAWPWGDYREDWLSLLEPAGYSTAFTTRPGPNAPGASPWKVRRFKVGSGEPGWLARRLWIYRRRVLGEIYGGLYGIDRVIKRTLNRRRTP